MAIAAARSVLRSSAARSAASSFASQPKPARSSFRLPTGTPLAQRLCRSPVEMSACVVSLQPYHTATASALMMSMLTVSRCGFGWLPEGCFLSKLNTISDLNNFLQVVMTFDAYKNYLERLRPPI